MSGSQEILKPVNFDGTPFASRVNELVTPNVTDVRRAKRGVYEALSDGTPRWTAYLVTAGATTLDAPVYDPLSMQFGGNPTADDVAPDDPSIRYVRGRVAAMTAVSGLALSGVIVPAEDADPQAPSEDRQERWIRPGEKVTLGIKYLGGGSGVTLTLRRPALAQAYMLADPDENLWFLDVDLFSEDIGDLVLSVRARRALREALTAFRRDLYLACASLLGVLSEAAWYAAAERLAHLDPKLEADVEGTKTAQLQRHVTEVFRARKVRPATLADELLAHAAILRDIRNYGVHPHEVRDDLERYFAEEACGLLILETHHYLTRLAGAVDEALAEGRA